MVKIFVQEKERTAKNTFDTFHKMIFKNKRNKFTEIILFILFIIVPLLTFIGIIKLISSLF